MYKKETGSIQGDLVTLNQMCEVTNLGSSTVRRLASEAAAVRKIGKSYRINRRIFLDYVEKNLRLKTSKITFLTNDKLSNLTEKIQLKIRKFKRRESDCGRNKILKKLKRRSALKRLQTIYWRKTDDCTSFPVSEPQVSAFTRQHKVSTILVGLPAAMQFDYGATLKAVIRGQR